ncbi:tail fiber protein [Tissierella praeacuta]|uniref:tail fiber protein n=1 Tax=Tissierella praeacuta TaxID=43131 RepID=UPI003DA5638A
MTETTQNYGFKKPEQDAFYNVDDFNYNADVMEKELKRIDDKTSNITVGDIKFSDGKTVEEKFTEVDNNISAKETPQASQEKANKALDAAKSYTDEVAVTLTDDLNTHKNQKSSTSTVGHVQLNDTVTSTSKTLAATANAVKTAYDKAKSVEGLMLQALPRGIIAMWSGSIANIPEGWALCDGNNGTPDLRDRFIVGAGRAYSIGATGGEKEVKLTEAQMPKHSHTGSTSYSGSHAHTYKGVSSYDGYGIPTGSSGRYESKDIATDSGGSHSHSFSTNTIGSDQPHENRPPYYALAFIMKL